MLQPASNTLTPIQLRGIIAAIASITAVGLSLSASLPLLALTLHARDISDSWIGINTAFSGVAAILATPVGPFLARKLGTPQALMLTLLLAAATLPMFYIFTDFWVWFPLRLLFHGASTSAFIISEFWINALAPPERRGFFVGIYATVLSAGFACGPFILATVGTTGIEPFLLSALGISIAALPILFALSSAPRLDSKPSARLHTFLLIAPAATLAAFTFGAVEQSSISLLPIFGIQIGFTPETAALLVSATAAGSFLLQLPIGFMADRMNRRHLLLICSGLGVLGAGLMPLVSGSLIVLMGILFLWGGIIAGMYTVGLVHLGARFNGADLASANAAFMLMYSLGQLIGPGLSGFALSTMGATGLPWAFFGFLAVYVVICLIRTIRVGPES